MPRAKTKSANAAASEDARSVARYLTDMTGQLETMARAAKLELVAYLLAMARAEAESITLATPPDRRRD